MKKSFFRRVNKSSQESFLIAIDNEAIAANTESSLRAFNEPPSSHSRQSQAGQSHNNSSLSPSSSESDEQLELDDKCLETHNGQVSSQNDHSVNQTLHDTDITFESEPVSNEMLSVSMPNFPSSEISTISQNKSVDFASQIKLWAIKNQISHKTINELLIIFRNHPNGDFGGHIFPKSARAFLGTMRNVHTKAIFPGEYCHLGVERVLDFFFILHELPVPDKVEIAVNIDGLPLSKSSGSQVYPILGLILGLKKNIMNVVLLGIYHGYQKPSDPNLFLEDFVNECVKLSNDGIKIRGTVVSFQVKFLLFDAPAKSFLLGIKGHSGYSSCTKCTQEGSYIKDRVCFPSTNFTKRTNETFRNHLDENHNIRHTILQNIEYLDMVNDIPLDYMHLVLLGVMKKLVVTTWIFGKPPHRLPGRSITSMDLLIKKISIYIPSDFPRKPRTVLESKRWKANEFRLFLLYTGIIIMKPFLPDEKYTHFLSLFVSMTILVSPSLCGLYDYAEKLLIYFVKETKRIYGPHFMSHNFHNLLHIVDCANRFGPLDSFSNFSSENFLQILKRLVRKGEKPLEQIVKRISEGSFTSNLGPKNTETNIVLKCEKYVSPQLSSPQFLKLISGNMLLNAAHKRDNCCKLKNGDISLVLGFSAGLNKESICALVRKFEIVQDFFDRPCKSSLVDTYFVQKLSNACQVINTTDITYKCVRIPWKTGFVVMPLLHTTVSN